MPLLSRFVTVASLMTRARRHADGTIEQVTWLTRRERGRLPVTLRFAMVGGRVECVRVEIGASFDNPGEPDPRPIQASDLRRLRLGELVEHAKRRRLRELEAILSDEGFPQVARRRARRALPDARDAVGKPRLSDADLDEVAAIYRAAWARGDPPTKAVADELHVARSTANKRVARARALGKLPPTSQGKASAAPRRGGRRADHGSKR